MRASPRHLIAFAVVTVLGGVWLRPTASAATSPPHAAQEVSLAALGVATQTLRGSAPSLTLSFPPSALGVAQSGSYLRVFFAHSAVAVGSTLSVSVGGTVVDVVPLSAGTAAGSVFLAQIPSQLLGSGRPTVVTFAYAVRPPAGVAGDALYGRIDADTAVHYELAADVGTIQAYPFSLLGGLLAGSLAGASLTVLLPAHPDQAELGAALRLVADSARLLRPAPLRLTVVLGGTAAALARGGSAALIVGRLDALGGAEQVLRAAGFVRRGGGWQAPDGRRAGGDDGVLAAVVSPWDNINPLLLVTGGSDAGLVKASDAVVGAPERGLAGHAAVVSGVADAAGAAAPASAVPLPGGVTVAGDGDQVIAFGVAALSPAPLTLRLAASSPASVDVRLGDEAVRAVNLPGAGGVQSVDVGTARSGMNGVVLDVRPVAPLHLDVSASLASGGLSGASGLDELPAPFLADPRAGSTHVLLDNAQAATVGAAATLLGALGSLAVAAPPELRVSVGGAVQVDGSPTLALGPPGSSLGVRRGLAVTATYASPAVAAGSAWVEELRLPEGQTVLWVAGDSAGVSSLAQALAARRLAGSAAVVDDAGGVHPTATATVQASDQRTWLDRLLPGIAGVLLLGPLAWAWWTGRLGRRESITAAVVAAAGLVWTATALAAGVPALLVVGVTAVALCLATALAMGTTSALVAAVGGLLLAIAVVLVDEDRPALLALGNPPSADLSGVARSAGWRWAAVAGIAGGMALAVVAGTAVRRRPRVVAPATSTFVLVGVDTAWEAPSGNRSAPETLAEVLGEQGLPPGVELVGRRRDEARHEDQVLLALGGSDDQHVREVVGEVEAAVRRRLGHQPHSQLVVVEEPGRDGGEHDRRAVDVVAQFEGQPDEVQPGHDQE